LNLVLSAPKKRLIVAIVGVVKRDVGPLMIEETREVYTGPDEIIVAGG
jgi:hypothetical protein